MQVPRGMRDILNSDMVLLEDVIETVRNKFRLYGYRPMETPAVESWETLSRKGGGGEAIRDEIYHFKDKSGRDIGLRFDLTVPAARVVAGSPDLTKPFKRYQIGRVWRYDRPQAGRYREFWQADIDIFGSPSGEAELLSVVSDVLNELGVRFEIRLNSRKILSALVPGGKREDEVFRSLDKLDKVGVSAVKKELDGILGAAGSRKLMGIVSSKGSQSSMLKLAASVSSEGAKELGGIVKMAEHYGFSNRIRIDFSMVRGLDYYTGAIFEITTGNGLSIGGGGRYDNLIRLFGGRDTPAVGFSFGVDRICDILKPAGRVTQAFIISIKPELLPDTVELAQYLRREGIRTETDLSGRNMKKQLEYCNSMGIPSVIFIGEKESKSGKYTLRNMESGKERALTRAALVKALQSPGR